MPMWGTTKADAADKPKHLVDDTDAPKEVQKAECTGILESEADGKNGSGWTMPAGGCGNVDAQREVIVCCKLS